MAPANTPVMDPRPPMTTMTNALMLDSGSAAPAYNVCWPVERAVGVGAIASMVTLMIAYVMIPTPIRLIGEAEAPVSTAEAPMPASATAGIDLAAGPPASPGRRQGSRPHTHRR